MSDSALVRAHHPSRIARALREAIPTPRQALAAAASAVLTVLAFPDFELWFLAWFSLAPLIWVVARVRSVVTALVVGWLWGIIFFLGTCWWLTYPMIRFAGLSRWFAYPLLILPVILGGVFPALVTASVFYVTQRHGQLMLAMSPLLWVSFEWLRYVITGQLWNALGYSQAFHPLLIRTAAQGGVYAVSFILVSVNVAIALAVLGRIRVALMLVLVTIAAAIGLSFGSHAVPPLNQATTPSLAIAAIQPNVPMEMSGDPAEMNSLLERHLKLTSSALEDLRTNDPRDEIPHVVIWPESPMNFSYSRDRELREVVANLARNTRSWVLLNSLEPAAVGGDQNSAVLVNEQGEIAARYDKIRLMPFGEYVPLPRWLPGASSVRSLVGEFMPGRSYTLMPLGAVRAGVFICIEAAHPGIARAFTHEGAGVLINISNDGYLGPTPVMRQHLANAVFRAVENGRPLVRVTNTGITAIVNADGRVSGATEGFQEATRSWTITARNQGSTFYTRHGDVFAYGCALISLGVTAAGFFKRRLSERS